MQALSELFTSDAGLMSLAVIGFVLGMGGFFTRYFLAHMKQDALRAEAEQR